MSTLPASTSSSKSRARDRQDRLSHVQFCADNLGFYFQLQAAHGELAASDMPRSFVSPQLSQKNPSLRVDSRFDGGVSDRIAGLVKDAHVGAADAFFNLWRDARLGGSFLSRDGGPWAVRIRTPRR